MHIVILAKVVPDYEVPANDFELSNNRAHERYKRMMGLYDENAIESGVQLKEKYSASLTILSYGGKDDIPVLRKAVAMGGEKLSLVVGDSDDPNVIAANLKMAIDKLEDVDLILAGQQSADMDRGVVHGMLAEMLEFAFIPQIAKIDREDGQWKVIQNTESGSRELKFGGNAVLSITSVPENVPRIPTVKSIFAAKKKPVNELAEIEGNTMPIDEVSVDIPQIESVCEFIPAEDDIAEAAKILLRKLREERYI
ncbi:electron transfer flavoprotein subunit beta [Desulfosarcina ovata subsp. sediminis]|uniref:Electron transfer flavoprotein subunit beta n=1 Tax=Desulfosarcina ovata subsp. sediminis TaxID=885957 RepID=A0A5K7ZHP5_9BACT|nr:electron transfer flavoprotein subunit beta/FixA family protein [Desulfosarcina ovata]BBO79467.1 electron transfer flavoprotein subunit beta [Desulfosarcina ovata subsp. sediminis]